SESGNGVRITQNEQKRYKDDGITSNGEWDGTVYLGLYQDFTFSDTDSVITSQGFSGNVKITFKYKTKNDSSLSGNAFYNMSIPGYVNLRIYEDKVSVLNSGSVKKEL
ncbi:MAG: hypothetical protein IJ942_05205, partial [Alistipes sp.]|nr:hypothetical protein [Alistipes sp.]